MKKKGLIITICVLVVLIIASLITKYIDAANVSTGHEPECCIKIVSQDGSKVTYWGLGYKVVRYVSVSPDEPYESNIGVKMGSWFMNYEKPTNVILDVKSFGTNNTFQISEKADVDFTTNLLKNSKYINEPCEGIADYAITYGNHTYNILIGCSEINRGGKQAKITSKDMAELERILVSAESKDDNSKNLYLPEAKNDKIYTTNGGAGKTVSFYNINSHDNTRGEEIEKQEDGWYKLPSVVGSFINYDGEEPKSVTAYFTPTGTDMEHYEKQVGFNALLWTQNPVSVKLTFAEEDTLGHLHFVFNYEDGNSAKSEIFNVLIEH